MRLSYVYNQYAELLCQNMPNLSRLPHIRSSEATWPLEIAYINMFILYLKDESTQFLHENKNLLIFRFLQPMLFVNPVWGNQPLQGIICVCGDAVVMAAWCWEG